MPALSPETAAALLPVLLEGIGGGVALHDSEMRRSFSNLAMDGMLGLPASLAATGTLLGDQLAALEAAGSLRPADVVGILTAFAGPGRQEFSWQASDGRHLALVVMDAPGSARLALCRDVTEARLAEQRLAAGRARVEHLLSRTRDVVVLMDPEGTILENSDRTGELLSLPPELARPGSTHQDILRHMVARGDFGAVADPEAFVRERREGILRARNVTFTSCMRDGTWVEYNFQLMEDGNLLGCVRDITALKTTELALEKERGMLATIIENLPDGVMLFDADFRWRIANKRLMEFQALAEDVAYPGARAADILRFQARRGDFGPPPQDPAVLEALVAEREALMRQPTGAQYVRLTAGGYWIEFNTRPLPDGGMLAFYRDITPLKQREAELEAERTLLREVLASNDAVVTVFDAQAKVLLANGLHEDLMGTPPGLFAPGADHAEGLRWMARRGDYGADVDVESVVRERMAEIYSGRFSRDVRRMPNGRWLERTYAPLSDGRVIGHARDITALKQREAELETERTLLREVLASNDAVVTVFDAEAKVLLANGRHEELLGTPPQIFAPGTSHAEGIRFLYRRGEHGPPGDAAAEEAFIARRLADIYAGRVTREIRRMANGRWIERTFAPLTGGGVIGHARDVTLLKEREEELEAERTLLREVIDSSDALLSLFDGDGRVLLANGRHKDLMGLPRAFFDTGASFAEGVRALIPLGFYGEVEDAEALVQERIREIYAGEVARFDRRMPGGQWLEFSYRRVSRGRLIAQARDITPLKQREAQLDTERTLLREVLDSSDSLITLYDSEARMLLSNGRFEDLLGMPEEMYRPGRTFHEIVRWLAQRGDFGEVRDLDAMVNSRVARVYSGEYQRYDRAMPNGRWIEFSYKIISEGRMIGHARDITELKLREAELDAERTLLREVLDSTDSLVTVFDAKARILLANSRHQELIGVPQELFRPGRTFAEGVAVLARRGDFGPVPDAEVDALVAGRIAQVYAGGTQRSSRQMPDGRWMEFTYVRVSDGRVIGHGRDITELKQHEEELTTERTMLREVLDSSDSVIIVLDAEGRVLLANGRFEELIGVPAEMHDPGRPFSEIIRYLYRRGDFGFDQDEETTVRARHAAVFAGEMERYVRLLPNGRWIEFNFKLISGGRVISFARDLSALRSREAELESERTLLREVLDSTDALVTLFDADARIILANERHAELLDAPQGLFAPGVAFRDGIRWLVERGDFGAVEDVEAEAAMRQEMVYARLRAEGSQRYARQMPGGRWVEFTYTLLSGNRMISHARDVTPLKSSEQAALAAQAEAEAARDAAEAAAQAKSAFLAAMSHEIRTPMNGVLGMMEILDRSELAPDQARSVAVMRESAQSLLRIIDDVLDFSKIEAGRMEVETLPFSLRGLIEGTVETLMPQARQRGLTLFADPPDPGPDWLEGDPTRVRQILFNLIGNALKFTERGFVRLAAQTRIEAHPGNDVAVVRLIVEDSGVGMDAATLARLFQPFTQADSSTTRRFGGTGLGLSIVRRLTELMEGEVRAESTQGRGSRFIVTLRLGIAEAPAAAMPVPAAPPASPGNAPLGRVLVVDDHPVNREVITRQLELLGIPAATADDGAQGLAHWQWHRPSVVLLDIHMPVMDGFEMARAIRQEEQAKGLPRTTLIAVTANALKGEAERCYAAGMDGFVAKPVTLDGLSRALGRFMPNLVREGASAGGALFDPDALRGLFGQDRERLLGILESFAEQAAHDITRLKEASGPRLAEAAHRLKGSARMVGARLLAEAAQAIEEASRANDVIGVEAARGQLEKLLADTLSVARPALGGSSAPG